MSTSAASGATQAVTSLQFSDLIKSMIQAQRDKSHDGNSLRYTSTGLTDRCFFPEFKFFNDVCENDGYRRTCFEIFDAAQYGDITTFANALCSQLKHLTDQDRREKLDMVGCAFIAAAALGHLVALRTLLKSGSKIISEKTRQKAFEIAAAQGHDKVVEFLLPQFPNLTFICPTHRRDALHEAIAKHGSVYIAQVLLPEGVDTKFSEMGLRAAAKTDRAQVVDWLLANKMISPDAQAHALLLAAQAGHSRIVDALLKKGGIAESKITEAVMLAVGHPRESIEVLLRSYTMPEAARGAAVQKAIELFNASGVELLLANGPIDVASRGTAVRIAANRELPEAKDSATIPSKPAEMSEANHQILASVTRMLLESGPITRADRGAAFRAAAALDLFHLIPLLLIVGSASAEEQGAPEAGLISSKDIGKAVVSAAVNGRCEVIRSLQASGLLLERHRRRALVNAAANGHIAIFELLPGSLGDHLKTAFVQAAIGGHISILDLLLKQETISYAIRAKAVLKTLQRSQSLPTAVIEFLLKDGSLQEAENGWALHLAARSKCGEAMVALLLKGPCTQEDLDTAKLAAARMGAERPLAMLMGHTSVQ